MTEPNSGDAGGERVPLVEVRGVSKSFGGTLALDAVSLEISAGRSHAIAGRNGAGKSTLVSILTGLVSPDTGSVRFSGQPSPDPGDLAAWHKSVACVYQHSMTIPELTVGENLFLNDYGRNRNWISWRAMKAEAQELLDYWGLNVDATSKAGDLSVGNRQLVEIARALRGGSRFVILDEPTAQLETKEIGQLFGHMGRLKEAGVTFLYISHHLQEIYEVCSDVTVFRDGRLIASAPVEKLGIDDLVSAMVGDRRQEDLEASDAQASLDHSRQKAAVIEVEGLTIDGVCADVAFSVRAGEVVGLAGLGGSGKLEVSRAIAGMTGRASGTVRIDGSDVPPGRVDLAIEAGLGYVPEDRRLRGYCENLATEENATLSITGLLGRWGFVSPSVREKRASELIESFDIVPRNLRFMTANMSGGNQQKTVVARANASNPAALLLVTPTAGVDIASKVALFRAIRTASAGALVVSDELDELAICDRVLVMFEGRIVSEYGAERSDRELVAAMEGVGQ